MGETLTNANPREITKIKTHHARIVVDGTAEKPYYSIEWYDHTKNEYFLGYSSYYIGYVFKWLKECFEIVEDNKTNADRTRSMTDDELNDLFHDIYNAGVDDASSYEWGHRKNSFEWTMDWLQQPAEGEGQ